MSIPKLEYRLGGNPPVAKGVFIARTDPRRGERVAWIPEDMKFMDVMSHQETIWQEYQDHGQALSRHQVRKIVEGLPNDD